MTSLPKTYKIAQFEKADAPLTFKDVELKQPSAGEVLVSQYRHSTLTLTSSCPISSVSNTAHKPQVKVLAVGVCHSDAGVQSGAFGNSFPITPGHEIIGDVVAVGDGEKRWKVKDRVGGPWHGGHDGTCKQCQRGQMQMCQNGAVNGVTRNGGYAEYGMSSSGSASPIINFVPKYKHWY